MKLAACFALLIVLGFNSISCLGQVFSVSGQVTDKSDAAPLPGVTIQLTGKSDTSVKSGAITDLNGNFSIDNLVAGTYSLHFNYVGYKKVDKDVTITVNNVSVGTIQLVSTARELKGVTVAGKQIRGEQKGDTSQFNADAYKTNPDATADDLVAKMPGVTSDGTGVKVNGETVQQVLVDGKPFFGSDPTVALKNLPAEVIDKIQIFDKLSDQSLFTGFDDGNAQKTMNIITKGSKREGVFGKVYTGYGTDYRYTAGGNMNFFNGDRRISVLGLANNINQQNFSSEDVLGIAGTGGQSRGSGRGGRGGNAANNFMVGQQGGIAATNSIGLNYSNNWGQKLKVSGSYFFNNSNNVNTSYLTRNYFTGRDTVLYLENTTSDAVNSNHRFNARMEYTIDTSNSVTFTPSLSLQQNDTKNNTIANNSVADVLQSKSANSTTALNNGYNASGNLLFQHKFEKPRRTVSLNINASLNEKSGDGTNLSSNDYYDSINTTSLRDQKYNIYNNSVSLSPNLTYTEPVGKKGQFQFSYNPSYSLNTNDKETFKKDGATSDYTYRDTLFSNNYLNTYVTQKGGISYRIGDRTSNFNIGANVQRANLDGEQQFPRVFSLSRSFFSVLPNAFYNYRYADGRNLRLMYRTRTNVPSVNQMQNVIDISNPLLLSTGNAELKQTYEQTLIVRYGLTKAKSGKNFFLNLYVNNTHNYIGNATYIPTRDSIYTDPLTNTSILINRGGQLSRPVNLDGYWSSRLFATYGMPVSGIKSNLNFNGGINVNRTPGLINNIVNYAGNYIPTLGLVLSSNVSEKLDFTLSYSGSYNIVNNTIQSQSNNNFFNQVATFRVNWIFLENFVLNSNVTNTYYTAFSGTGSQSFYLWNAYLGYKLFKKTLEARMSVYDLLNQNTSINRAVTETYIENSNTQVLTQYFMFQLTYTVRKFKSGAAPELEKDDEITRPHGGDPRHRDH
jgi:hypothetical protein